MNLSESSESLIFRIRGGESGGGEMFQFLKLDRKAYYGDSFTTPFTQKNAIHSSEQFPLKTDFFHCPKFSKFLQKKIQKIEKYFTKKKYKKIQNLKIYKIWKIIFQKFYNVKNKNIK